MSEYLECPLRATVVPDAWRLNGCFENAKVGCGSIAPIRFLRQRAFDQHFAWIGSPIFERPLYRFLHCRRGDELCLLRLETSHSRPECFEA